MSRIQFFLVCIPLVAAPSLAACSSDNGGSGTSASNTGSSSANGGSTGSATTSSSSASTTANVSFSAEILPLFQKNCSTGGSACHGDEGVRTSGAGGNREYLGPSTGTPASAIAATVIAAIVGVASVEDPSMDVVAAGDPTNSFLMHKMDKTQAGLSCTGSVGCGNVMPFGSAAVAMPSEKDDNPRS